MAIIKRCFDLKVLPKIKADFKSLLKTVRDSDGELDFQIRPNNSFNIYYKGNSLASVAYNVANYKVRISSKFLDAGAKSSVLADKRFSSQLKNNYYEFVLTPSQIKPFFQKKHLTHLQSKIKEVNYQEELILEQSIITDNIDNSKWIIIDRQIRDKGFTERMDLLALKKEKDWNKYSFVVLEVKLGNNPTIRGCDKQLNSYITQIDMNFNDYKINYEENYSQKVQLGLINNPVQNISIVKPVKGVVLIGRYKGEYKKYISSVKSPLIFLYNELK
jgi:hypothetical protein